MFESLIQIKTTKTKINSTKIKKFSLVKRLSPATEGFLGNVFKGKEKVLSEAKNTAEEKLTALYNHFEKNLFPKAINNSKENIEDFIEKMNKISELIKKKKLNSQKFSELTFNKTELQFHVLSDGLYKINEMRSCLDKVISEAESINLDTIDEKKLNHIVWNITDSFELNEKTSAYFGFNGTFQSLHHMMGREELGEYYSVERGTKVSAAGYPSDFVTHTLSQVNSIVSSIRAFYPYEEKVKEVYDLEKEKISKITDRHKVHNPIYILDVVGCAFYSALESVSDQYLSEAVRVAKYIAENCYG